MINISNYEVVGFEHAIRGMRNPMNSWDKSDSEYKCPYKCPYNHPTCIGCHENFCIGKNDLSLMQKLFKAGTDHRKFMRMIVAYADITAPMYWWKEFDTYKVATVRNSCSTMHKITDKAFEESDFSFEAVTDTSGDFNGLTIRQTTINLLENYRQEYLRTQSKRVWKALIQLLPSSYNTKATVFLNYEVLANMYFGRKDHKLDEWHEFCDWALGLPYFKEIIGIEDLSHLDSCIDGFMDIFRKEE